VKLFIMIELNNEERVIEFLSFCIENFKVKHSMSGKDVAILFKQSGVLEFVSNGYEVLHTQGKEYILEEIDIFLKNRGYEF
jgi:transcription termination factor Rho